MGLSERVEIFGELWSEAVRPPLNVLRNVALYRKPIRYVQATTELKVLTPAVDLQSELGTLSPGFSNEWKAVRVPRLGFAQYSPMATETAQAFVPWASALHAQTAFAEEEMVGLCALVSPLYAQSWVGETAEGKQKSQIDLASLSQLAGPVELANSMTQQSYAWTFPTTEGPAHRAPTVGVLWEQAAELSRAAGQQLTNAAKHSYASASSFVRSVQEAIDAALLPTPAYGTAPVRTRGAVRTSGPSKTPSIGALVLNQEWSPERSLELPVLRGPEIESNQLTLEVGVHDPTFEGRRASLVLVVGSAEVALVSAPITPTATPGFSRIGFQLDLPAAHLRSGPGKLVTDSLQVIVEPSSGTRTSKDAERGQRSKKREGGPHG